MLKRVIEAVRDRKTQTWLLLACLVSFFVSASTAAALFWTPHGIQRTISLISSLVSTEVVLVLCLCITVIQIPWTVFCMYKGRPIFPSCRRKRLVIILIFLGLMQVVQGTTGAAGSLNSFVSKTFPPKNVFKRNLSMFTWPALVASAFYTLAANLTVILALSAGTANTGDVESGGNITLPFLPPAQAFPGPLWSLVHRGLQFSLALWALLTMSLASDYQVVKPFVFLVQVLISHCLWSGILAIVGLCTMWGYGSHLLRKPLVRSIVYFGDLIMMGILLHAVCGAASIVFLIKYDLQQCFENNCEVFLKSTMLAFASHMALFVPTIYTTVKRLYT